MRIGHVALAHVLWLCVAVVCSAQHVDLRQYTVADGLAHNSVSRIFQDSRGFIWFLTTDGLSRFDGHRFVTFRRPDGLPAKTLVAIGETEDGLWVASHGSTVFRVNDREDEPPFSEGPRLQMARDVRTTRARFAMGIRGIHARVFESTPDEGAPLFLRGTSSVVTDVLYDRGGALWIATSASGVFTAPSEVVVSYTAADELPDNHVLRLVESNDGRMYAVTRRGGVVQLADDRVEPLAGSLFAPFHTIGRRIRQDEDGFWWVGTDAGVFTGPGPTLSFFSLRRAQNAWPAATNATGLFVDSRGWQWRTLPGGGVSRCRVDGRGTSRCVEYGAAAGIGHVVASIAEDAFGRVYFGTNKGLIRFAVDGGIFREFLPRGRLTAASVTHCVRDRRGRIWSATTSGVYVISPRSPASSRVPQVLLTNLHVNGARIPVPPRGAFVMSAKVDSRADALRIEYAGPSFEGDGPLRYQHRIATRRDAWSPPTSDAALTYSQLSPGFHRIEVRALTIEGTAGPPATLTLTIARPLWASASVVLGCAGLLTLGGSVCQLQRAHRRRDLTSMPLRVFGRME